MLQEKKKAVKRMFFPKSIAYYYREYFPLYYRIYYAS
jgi:hypothetical protein